MNEKMNVQLNHTFDQATREAFYSVLYGRRDVRGQFLTDPIDNDVLARILKASHHAPSVGFMQPWDFVVVRSETVKQQIHAGFVEAHEAAAEMFEGEQQEVYKTLKLEGILESPVNICVTCDRLRHGPVVIGRTAIKTMDLYSSVCAVQNLWLAARAEGLGVGWVSIVKQSHLKEVLGLPVHVVPIAYLCIGYVSDFFAEPELQSAGWIDRMPLADLIAFDHWNQRDNDGSGLLEAVRQTTIG